MEKSEKTNETQCYLPMDIIIPILEILPIKALVRFLCASKTFSSIILKFTPPAVPRHNESPNCVFSINSNSSKNSFKLYLEDEYAAFVCDFPCKTTLSHIVSSCNGVLCVVDNFHPPFSIFLWNPSIQKSVRIPIPNNYRSAGLLGFGYDPIRDDYKLVWIANSKPYPIMLYSLKSNKWRSHSEIPPNDLFYYSDYPYLVYVNGACHWLLRCLFHDPLRRVNEVIFTFHMEDEVFRQLALPESVNTNYEDCPRIFVFKGLLSFVASGVYFNCCIPLWVMEEYGNPKSWTKLFNIDLGFVNRNTYPMCPLIGFRASSEDILIRKGSKLLLCRPETQKILSKCRTPYRLLHELYWGPYRESFGLLNVKNEKSSSMKEEGRKNGWMDGWKKKIKEKMRKRFQVLRSETHGESTINN